MILKSSRKLPLIEDRRDEALSGVGSMENELSGIPAETNIRKYRRMNVMTSAVFNA
jgi:hypothetical protein